jgi:hypothetical protein
MRVVLSGWVVGDGQLPEPVVGEVIGQRMLIVSPDRLTCVEVNDVLARPDEIAGEDGSATAAPVARSLSSLLPIRSTLRRAAMAEASRAR